MVLIAADGDYIPLVKKLHALGTRVMVLGWDLEHEGEQKKEPTTTYTSFELLEEATYPVMMNELSIAVPIVVTPSSMVYL